jgi:ceramide glucosyltransferase
MLLLLLATILLCLTGASVVLHVIAAIRLRRFFATPSTSGEGGPALTLWRALKPGIPDLEGKLNALVASSRLEDQILVGIDAESSDLKLCESWRSSHPSRDIHLVRCEAGRAANPKISKFLQMAPHARQPHWLLTDSEALLSADFVEAIRREWSASGADTMTAGYRFRNLRSISQTLDALPAAMTLWPGLMLTPRVAFTLGACTAIRAGDLDSIGGWASVAHVLAEDHELGRRLALKEKSIALSHAVLDLETDPLTFGEYLRHQHRVAVTYRAANPAGALGLAIVHGMPLGVLAWVLHPPFWTIALILVLLRGLLAIAEARIAGELKGPSVLLAPVVPLIEGCFWLIAWWMNWSGQFATR